MENSKPIWTRSKDGWLAGVCSGLSRQFDIEIGLLRIIWVIGIFFGLPILLYFILAISLPREDQIEKSKQPKILGLCLRLSKKFDIEVGLIRSLALISMLISFGMTLLLYFVIHMVLVSEDKKTTQN